MSDEFVAILKRYIDACAGDRDEGLRQWVHEIDASMPGRAARCSHPPCRRARRCRGITRIECLRTDCRMVTEAEDMARLSHIRKLLLKRYNKLKAEGKL
jgi:hypothetical protein